MADPFAFVVRGDHQAERGGDESFLHRLGFFGRFLDRIRVEGVIQIEENELIAVPCEHVRVDIPRAFVVGTRNLVFPHGEIVKRARVIGKKETKQIKKRCMSLLILIFYCQIASKASSFPHYYKTTKKILDFKSNKLRVSFMASNNLCMYGLFCGKLPLFPHMFFHNASFIYTRTRIHIYKGNLT